MKLSLLTLMSGLLVVSLSFADEAEKKCGLCPVSGKPATEDITMDYKGKKIYFCCPGCAGAVEKAPEKFAAKLHHQLLVSGQIVQVGCPMSGGKVDAKTMVELEDAKFGFCCGNCQKKYEEASDDDKLTMVFAKLGKAFTLQDKCPVSGKPINVAMKTEYKGKNVYFCCGGCPKAFEADPEKFAAKLPKDDESEKKDKS